MDNNTYFAARQPDETAAVLLGKAQNWFNNLESNGYLEKLRSMWLAYYGAYDANVSNGHKITFTGDQGELVKLNVNHFRNLAQHLLVMITSSRPSMEARATNTDYKSLVQTRLANGLLDYYMREKRLEKYLKTAVESAIVLGAGYIKMEWNSMTGEIIEFNDETNSNVYEGDIQFTNLSPFDVVFDGTKENAEHDWVLCRSFKNRYDIIAKYPEFEDQILSLPTKSDYQNYNLNTMNREDTDDIAVYEFYHKRTESVSDGRYLLFLSDDIVLLDAPLPYRSLPVYRIVPSDILGTPHGYSPMFDILPIQEAINSLYSTILTNNNAFGTQNLYVPRNADISINNLFGGLNIIEGNAKPEALQLTATAPETYKFLEQLERVGETLSGVNAVARGNPPTSLESGTALALVQSMALQFVSGLQISYVQLIEDTGTGLINILKDFAAVPRVAAIVGKSNRTYMKEFNGKDLENVNRVIVDVGNALSRTTAGRVEMAQQMLQMKVLTSPEQYFQIIETGKLEVLTENNNNELLLIKSENEKMVAGEDVKALALDKHLLHINEHKGVLSDPDLRMDPNLVTKVLMHIQEHIGLMRTTDPALLQIIGEQPLGPIAGTPPNMSPEQIPQPTGDNLQQMPSAQGVPATPEALPQVPSPEAPFQNLPTNPADVIPGG
jgi:hypothetical protein